MARRSFLTGSGDGLTLNQSAEVQKSDQLGETGQIGHEAKQLSWWPVVAWAVQLWVLDFWKG
jgi:hypothetical protein